MAYMPLLIDPSEFKIVDLHAGKRGFHTNWAVVYRGGVIKDHFATDAVALAWVRSHLIEPSQVTVDRHRIANEFIVPLESSGTKSWSAH
jgi:hypothetical protein